MFDMSISSGYLRITIAICLLLCSTLTVTGRDVALELRESDRVPSRRMVPAQVNSPLKSRNTEKPLRYEHVLHYLEGNQCISLVLHKACCCFELPCYSMRWHHWVPKQVLHFLLLRRAPTVPLTVLGVQPLWR